MDILETGIMDKTNYVNTIERIKKEIKQLETIKTQIGQEYIETNKPCEVDQLVEIVTSAGRRITGEAKTFRIMQDYNVYIDSLNIGKSKRIYISQPYKSIKLL
jgi:hypothetical protein